MSFHQCRTLADKCAAAGYLVAVPDFLHGDPFDKSNPNRTFQAWSDAHPIVSYGFSIKCLQLLLVLNYDQITFVKNLALLSRILRSLIILNMISYFLTNGQLRSMDTDTRPNNATQRRPFSIIRTALYGHVLNIRYLYICWHIGVYFNFY